jgi:dolichol kinase
MTEAHGGSSSPAASPPDRSQKVQPFIELERSATIDYRSELIRKAIHLCSLSIPIIYEFISRQRALELLVPLTIAAFAVDLARYSQPSIAVRFYRWFGFLLRQREVREKRLNGATYVLLASTVCVFLFPKLLVINALAVLIISDSTSALVGRRFGKRRFLNKTLEGSFAFFLSAVLVLCVTPKVSGLPLEYAIGIIAAFVATVVESAPFTVDDNLTVPLSICITMWLLYSWLLPAVLLGSIV